MDNDTILTDDYVAGLMAKEASDASIKYSAVGLEAFRSSKYAPPHPPACYDRRQHRTPLE